ncbi:MAG: hypothetical protein V4722_19660 [Bacteroidota bacterium]
MSKTNIIGVLVSIVAGLALTLTPYAYALYLLFLAAASILVLIFILTSILRKNSDWKMPLKFLSFGLVAALTTYLTFNFLEYQNKKRGDNVISALYDYRQKEGRFPGKISELPKSISQTRGNYIPDPTLTNFRFYYRDLYGFPRIFSGKDSAWER